MGQPHIFTRNVKNTMQGESALSGAPENIKGPKRMLPHQCLPPEIFLLLPPQAGIDSIIHHEQQDVRPL